MSKFEVPVCRIKIEPHPHADKLELAVIGDYRSVVGKGQFKTGDLAVYIPEQSVLPEWLIEKMGLIGKLSGSAKNRVRAVKLRGVLSQGLVLGGNVGDDPNPEVILLERSVGNEFCPVFASEEFTEGNDAAEFLGIVKYEPPIPTHMTGRIAGVDLTATHKYDFENLKKHPTLFGDGEPVVVTEKIHGTLMQVGVVPESMRNERYYMGRVVISSKGMGAKGFVLDHTDESNLYVQAAMHWGIPVNLLAKFGDLADELNKPIFLLGEVFGKTRDGKGIQDLTYGDGTLKFRAFDICYGNRGSESYMVWNEFERACQLLGIEHVPVLYIGPYSREVVTQHTDGMEAVSGSSANIREGVVVKSALELKHPHYGRKIAKSISEAYLMRQDATEFN